MKTEEQESGSGLKERENGWNRRRPEGKNRMRVIFSRRGRWRSVDGWRKNNF